jgi:hypothetical protein
LFINGPLTRAFVILRDFVHLANNLKHSKMKTIIETPLSIAEVQTVKVPRHTDFLGVIAQKPATGSVHDKVTLIGRGKSDLPAEDREIRMYAAGENVNEFDLDFIGYIEVFNPASKLYYVFENK